MIQGHEYFHIKNGNQFFESIIILQFKKRNIH